MSIWRGLVELLRYCFFLHDKRRAPGHLFNMTRDGPINGVTRPARIAARQMPELFALSTVESTGHWLHPDVQIQVYTHCDATQSIVVPAVAEPLLVLVLSGRARVQEREAGREWSMSDVGAGDFFLTMTDEPYELRWQTLSEAAFRVVHLYLSQRLLEVAARESLHQQAHLVRLRDVSGASDKQLARLVTGLYEELIQQDTPSTLYAAGLAQALGVHLVRTYRAEVDVKPKGALQAYRLQRVITLMESSLDSRFNLGTLAAAAGLSDFYFSRLFHRATGCSPSQYFIQLRLAKARQLLAVTSMSIIEIALDVGYASPGHFAQVFRRHNGVTPREYRQQSPLQCNE
ncbi:helix-turn-helix domain-containing protein [Pseudomonas sp. PWP3-1b2]|uniref:AraC family transcriptional regulator n=1 Tax=Pseudomonas sp. PWP3-1b2 TaxID=2804656 RepID=UPI003CF241D9